MMGLNHFIDLMNELIISSMLSYHSFLAICYVEDFLDCLILLIFYYYFEIVCEKKVKLIASKLLVECISMVGSILTWVETL